MYLNHFAHGTEPFDMTATEEYRSLLTSARDLGIEVPPGARYVARNVVVNGLRFHVLEWGEPSLPGLVLLHGGGQTAHSWDLVALALSDRFHALAIDQRGHGDTEWPRDGERSRHAMASDVERIIALERLEKPIVIGHSMGGIVTMTLLDEHRGIASKAVLVDVGPAPAPNDNAAQAIINFVRGAREFDSVEEFVERVAGYDPYRAREHIERTVRFNLMQRYDGKFVSKSDSRSAGGPEERPIQRILGPSFDDTLRSAGLRSCPVLLVRGGESQIVKQDAAERFVSRLPLGSLAVVPRCGHNVHTQNTAGFLEAVTPFLTA